LFPSQSELTLASQIPSEVLRGVLINLNGGILLSLRADSKFKALPQRFHFLTLLIDKYFRVYLDLQKALPFPFKSLYGAML
jgi:hypothetical protein